MITKNIESTTKLKAIDQQLKVFHLCNIKKDKEQFLVTGSPVDGTFNNGAEQFS